MEFKSFCYNHFGFLSDRIIRLFPWLSRSLELSGSKTHPSIYLSMLIFIGFLSFIYSLTIISLMLLNILIIPLIIAIPISLVPLLIIFIGSILPALSTHTKLYNFELELPYVAAYLAIMVSSGLPMLYGLKRLRKVKLFNNTSRYVSKIETLSMIKGITPILALERFSKKLGIKSFEDLVLGYSSTLRSGGDVSNYMSRKAELLFQELFSRVKASAEKLTLLMETSISVTVLGGIGLYLVFVASVSMSDVLGITLSPEAFFIFSFIMIPILCCIFIYLSDTVQISYPEKFTHRYIVFLLLMPFLIIVIVGGILPYVFSISHLQIIAPLMDYSELFIKSSLRNRGFTPAFVLCITLIIITIPSAIYDILDSRRSYNCITGMVSFLRDLVEVRKSGLTPEKCLLLLSKRNYGEFSKVLRRIVRSISWGIPLRKAYEMAAESLKKWLISVNLFLLIDTIEVGGGTIETLESMAKFSEMSMLIEKERRTLLRPLILMPYVGVAILTIISLIFLSFINDILTIAGTSLSIVTLVSILITPIPLHAYMLGLIAGKISSGRISGGFLHATFLVIIVLAALFLVPNINLGWLGGG